MGSLFSRLYGKKQASEDMAGIEKHMPFYKSLSEEESLLLTFRDVFYHESWDEMEKRIKNRWHDEKARRDLESIRKLRDYEQVHEMNLAECTRYTSQLNAKTQKHEPILANQINSDTVLKDLETNLTNNVSKKDYLAQMPYLGSIFKFFYSNQIEKDKKDLAILRIISRKDDKNNPDGPSRRAA